ncbi:MAG: formate--tetrahydrofolate ligase [Actinomycetota bacterium]
MSGPDSLELAQRAVLRPIEEVAREAGLRPEEIEPYGRSAAKVDLGVVDRLAGRPDGRVVVVTGITPTSLGEGKTTTSIGLVQGLERVGAKAMLCLREPSVGPVFGAKGGGTGGGHAQVVPMEDINLHFTGDFHAVAAAHNLLAAALDASLHHGNPLGIEPRTVTWPRALDVNDRALRNIVVGLGGKAHGVPRESGFVITAASEIMAILGMSTGVGDLRARLGRIVVGETGDGRPVTAEDLRAAGAMAVLLRHAVRPNLAQTLEGRPALIHTGPFGNIASGNSSVIADRVAMKLADVVVTESGFGSDLGFEKFCHLVAPAAGITPSAAVVVATVRALRMHGGLDEVTACAGPDPEALEQGSANLAAHIDDVHAFGLPAVVAVNRIEGDTDAELEILAESARDLGADEVAVCDGFTRGGAGAEDLAKALLAALERPASFAPVNPPGTPVREQIERIATRLYGAEGVELSAAAERALARLAERGLDRLPVCMAKSHLSLSHDPTLKARPTGFTLPVRDVVPSVGAGFVVVLCGDQLLMPGLGREPSFTGMDVDDEGHVVGLS